MKASGVSAPGATEVTLLNLPEPQQPGTGQVLIAVEAAGVEVTETASPSAEERLRSLGAADVIDYHDPAWPARVQGGFDAALIAAPGTAATALPLIRDRGHLCSLTSDAPNPERGIISDNLYARPDPAQLARLITDLAQGLLRLTPEPLLLTGGTRRIRAGERWQDGRPKTGAHTLSRGHDGSVT
jgi:NADPH:quinone reductase-like Zn-dependent oxidoreductase